MVFPLSEEQKMLLAIKRVIYDRDKEQKIKHFEFAAFLNDKLQECGGNSNEKNTTQLLTPGWGSK